MQIERHHFRLRIGAVSTLMLSDVLRAQDLRGLSCKALSKAHHTRADLVTFMLKVLTIQ